MNTGYLVGNGIWGVIYYSVLGILVIIFGYLGIRALQAIISIERTFKDLVAFTIDREKKKEEREMRRI